MKRVLKATAIGLIIPVGIVIGISRVMMTSDCACTDKADAMVNFLCALDGAKNQWVLDHPKDKSVNLTWTDLTPYFSDGFLTNRVVGETYHINTIGEPASAFVPHKTDWIPENSEVRRGPGPDGKIQIRSTAPGSVWTDLDLKDLH
jgi:hypothetical protein